MKIFHRLARWLPAALVSLCAPGLAIAADAFIAVKQTTIEPSLDPGSPAWSQFPATEVILYPQLSTEPATGETPVTAKLRALASGRTIAIHLEWPDGVASREHGIGKFADAVALQWPLHFGPGRALPYVGMGQAGAPVVLWWWRADGGSETLAAEGFGTLTAQPPDGVQARGEWNDGTWRVVFTRTHAAEGVERVRFDPAQQGLVPVAVAIWNGDATERNGLKRLSAWQLLRFEKGRVDAAYAKQLSGTAVAGDIARGKSLMSEKGCAGCHRFPGNPAQPLTGPDLSYAGGIHSAAYLLESLVEPSTTIVPGKGYFMRQGGKTVSLMPAFAGTETERNHLLAYLASLR